MLNEIGHFYALVSFGKPHGSMRDSGHQTFVAKLSMNSKEDKASSGGGKKKHQKS